MRMDSCKLFIGGISWETTEDSLREYFQSYGKVLEVVIMKDRATGRARGFGFIVFADCSVADKVVLKKHRIDGKTVEAKKAVPKDDHMILSKSNSSLQGSPGPTNTKKIFVGGLASSVTEAEFKKYFAKFGTITDVVVMYDHKTQRPRGFGFITYDSEEAVDTVLQRTFHELDEKVVEVKVAVPKETSPNQNRSLTRVNSFGSTLLNDYTQGFNLSPISDYAAKPEGRYSLAAGNRGSFPPYGHKIGIDLKCVLNQGQSSGYNRGFGRPLSPGYNANLSRHIPYRGQGDDYVSRKQLWENNCGTKGYISNSGVGTIGEKWGTVGEGRSYRDYINGEMGIGYDINNEMGIESRGGNGNTSSLSWGTSDEESMSRFEYMNNIVVRNRIAIAFEK